MYGINQSDHNHEWIKKMWNISTKDYFLAKRRMKVLSFAGKLMQAKPVLQSAVLQ
jgi:hypothetical protein